MNNLIKHVRSITGISMPSSRSLWDIVKREQFEKHNAVQIKDIWNEFHSDPTKHRISSILVAPQYYQLAQNANSSPLFILPVFKGPNAFENFFVQFQLPHVLFTTLESYKQLGAGATPALTLTHYTELTKDKGIVLIRGDILNPSTVTRLEAQTLLRLSEDFYLDPRKHEFVRAFNHKPSDFDLKRMLDSLGHDTSNLSPE